MEILQGVSKTPVKLGVLHCASLNNGQFDGLRAFEVFATIDRWHRKERKFKHGFGYHGFFMPDGTFHAGRPFSMIGAHCLEVNRIGSLGFLIIESNKILPVKSAVRQLGQFEQWFTSAQGVAVRSYIDLLRRDHGVTAWRGHNDYASKLCPGFDVQQWLANG
jgi:N-acetylmuramoyl-L-alanine amidase